jgi:hypothetical protein
MLIETSIGKLLTSHNSRLQLTVTCTTLVYFVTVMSVVTDVEKLIWEVERRPPLYTKNLKGYSDRNLKEKLWYEVCESVITK